jgi:hypothetical protein
MFRGSDSTKITLGKEVVKVVNDGGLGIYYHRGRGFTRWNYDPPQRDSSGVTRKRRKLAKSKPVLSFKVFFRAFYCDDRRNESSLMNRMREN